MSSKHRKVKSETICFGLNRKTDEQSLYTFIQLFAGDSLQQTLIPRLSKEEMGSLVHLVTGLLHAHLTEKEYHQLFLGESSG